MIGKQHFTLLYDRARTVAFTPRNIKSGWFNSGLVPLNPARVLNARIMTYDDIVEAEQKRAAKVSAAGAKRGGRRPKSSKPGEEKDRAQMNWKLARLKSKRSVGEVLFCPAILTL
jgi:hypothetical protein